MVLPDEERVAALRERCGFGEPATVELRRSIVVVEVTRIADSCGYGVPLMRFESERPHLDAWAQKKLRSGGPDALLDYQRSKNARSLDGLPAVEVPAPVDAS